MKIDDRMIHYEIGKMLPKSVSEETGKAGEKQVSGKSIPEARDPSGQNTIVHLSRASKEVQLINKVISAEPDVREDRVVEMKARIESGRYHIDNDAVADKLVDAFMDDLF